MDVGKSFSDYGIAVDLSGSGNQKTTCPQCTPTRKKQFLKDLSVNITDGLWFCHHCGWSGSLKIFKPEYMNPIQKVFKKPQPFKKNEIPDSVADWFKNRGISKQTLKSNSICWANQWMPQTQKEEHCIVFQYYMDGELINRKYRDNQKNMRMEKDGRLILYAPWAKTRKAETKNLYLTEGEPDALTLLECGYKDVMSIPNGAPPENVNIENVDFSYLDSLNELMPDIERIYLVMDSDSVGLKVRDELARRLGKERCLTVEYPDDCKDINDVLVNIGKDLVEYIINEAKPYPVDGKYTVNDIRNETFNLYENGFTKGAKTGWPDVDRIYRPTKGYFTVVTGIPNHGKSNFMDSLMINLSRVSGWKHAVYSPENYPFERHLAGLSHTYIGKPFDKNYNGHMSKDDLFDALKWLNKHFVFLMPPEEDGMTLDNILNLAKVALLHHGINGLVIDPWNEIEHDLGKDSETNYVSKSLSKIRRFARVNSIHIWLIAHPTKMQKNKDGEYPPPTPYDISGSANWRNKPDHCLCIHRPDFTNRTTQVLSQKTRFREMGSVGDCELQFDIKENRYK